MLYSIVGILVIIIDQLVKFWVEDTLFGTDVVRFIPGVLSLVNVHNYGAAFGFLDTSGARIYFVAAAGLFALLVVIALATNFITGRLSRWCLVLVAAGGLANMIDRVMYGYVVDMFKVELFNFPVFNVADIFITVFSILFVLAMFFEKPDDEIDQLFEDDEAAEQAAKKERKRKKQEALPASEPDAAPAEEAKPAKQKKVSAARKARQDKYEKEYEAYKAQQQEAMRKASAARSAAAQQQQQAPRTEDPFAAWEMANARAEASRADDYAGRVMQTPAPQELGAQPKPAPKAESAPAPKAEAAPAPKAEPKPAPVPAPAPKAEVKPAAPAPAPKAEPKPAPKAAAAEEDFNLDDILAEFR